MLVQQLLIETLDDLLQNDFEKLKWYLTLEVLPGCKAMPKSRLERAERTDTVTRMMQSYGQESAVNVAVEILKKMNNSHAAETLKNRYEAAGGKTSAPSSSSSSSTTTTTGAPVAAPASMLAQQGSNIIAPSITGSTLGKLNITIHK